MIEVRILPALIAALGILIIGIGIGEAIQKGSFW